MPDNVQALLLLVLFIAPGFVFIEVHARRRPTRKLGTFDKTVLTVLFSTILHVVLVGLVLAILYLRDVDLNFLFDQDALQTRIEQHAYEAYLYVVVYFFVALLLSGISGLLAGRTVWRAIPVFARVVRRDKENAVLVQMKNGDFFTGILGLIPGDYDVLQGPAKDFTISPPGRYKPKDRDWQSLQMGETVVLNTTNVDALRIIIQDAQGVAQPSAENPPESTKRSGSRKKRA